MHSRKSSMVLGASLMALVAAFVGNAWAADNARILYTFTGGADGQCPYSDLILDGQGNLYGTTIAGGAFGSGTVFKLTSGSNGKWSETVLHSFHDDGKDGLTPQAGVIFDKAGNLWGTTSAGGTNGGTVFELTPGPNGTWSETVLSVGGQPGSDLIFDKAGNIYGTAAGGVFEVAPASSGARSITTLYSFQNDAIGPHAALILDEAGNLYGTTQCCGMGRGGTVFKLTRGSNGAWVETVLHIFVNDSMGKSPDGYNPQTGLVFDAAGNLYGTTQSGGASLNGDGTVFKLAPGSNGAWSETVLHSFNILKNKDGRNPLGQLVLDAAGNLYGTTQDGGKGGGGTVFKLAPGSDGAWTETVLHGFDYSGRGQAPKAGVIFDAAGNLYVTTSSGNNGTVFEILAGSHR
jgi:uncharacterized repeat protein (TIGR03803 family)